MPVSHFVGICRCHPKIMNILSIHTVLFAVESELMTNTITAEVPAVQMDLSHWQTMLADKATLLAQPGAHHKALLTQAYALHENRLIDSDHLCDLLELADGALAFAVESMLDIDCDE